MNEARRKTRRGHGGLARSVKSEVAFSVSFKIKDLIKKGET